MSSLLPHGLRLQWLSARRDRQGLLRLSAPAYGVCVAVATGLGIAAAMLLRPAFAHSVRAAIGLEQEIPATPGSFYAVRVSPLFDSHCASCHGAQRQKGKLRLDSYAAAMRGGRSGPVFDTAGAKDGELFKRITLPQTDGKAMPPDGKPPLKADDITVIRLWLENGASGVLSVAAIKNAPPMVVQVRFAEIDPHVVRQERAVLSATVEQLQARFPGVIAYVSRGSADLEVNASLLGTAFGDAQLAALAPLHDRIVRADFSRTLISDASLGVIAGMGRLRMLRLTDTSVTDSGVAALAGSSRLRSLTLAGTAVSQETMARLRRKGIVIHATL